jgi:ribosome-associated toxin RatA of RatAB toxin-antitoxin module
VKKCTCASVVLSPESSGKGMRAGPHIMVRLRSPRHPNWNISKQLLRKCVSSQFKKYSRKLPVKKLYTSILILFILISHPLRSSADSTDWTLQKNENGISVYTRLTQGSHLKEVRVVNVVSSSLSSLIALLLDVKNYPNWIYGCSEASILNVINDHEQYQYQVTDVPWPVSDRDVASHFKIEQDAATKIVTVINTGKPGYIPEKKDRVRVQHFQSNYKFTPLPDGKVKVEFELFVDPGGNVPAWLINSNIVTAPYKTTVAMIKQLPGYQNASVAFITEK